jgi:two-component system, sensor histidine kinase and response regulator
LHHAAHTLKGSVANFCAQEPFESAYRLERMGRAGDLAGAEEALAALERQLLDLEPSLVALQQGPASEL